MQGVNWLLGQMTILRNPWCALLALTIFVCNKNVLWVISDLKFVTLSTHQWLFIHADYTWLVWRALLITSWSLCHLLQFALIKNSYYFTSYWDLIIILYTDILCNRSLLHVTTFEKAIDSTSESFLGCGLWCCWTVLCCMIVQQAYILFFSGRLLCKAVSCVTIFTINITIGRI